MLLAVWAVVQCLGNSALVTDVITPATPPPPFSVVLNVSSQEVLVLPFYEVGRLNCQDGANKEGYFIWRKDGLVQATISPKPNIMIVNGKMTQNAGLYQCTSNSGESAVVVFIEGSDSTLTTSIGEPDSIVKELEVAEGGLVELSVSLSVYPVERISYRLMYLRILDQQEMKVASYPETDLSSSVLLANTTLIYTAESAGTRDHGMYKFLIQYGDVTKTISFFVTVTSAPTILSFKTAPQFVSVGENVAFTLTVAGYPTPQITWYHKPCCPELPTINLNERINSDTAEFRYYHLINDGSLLNLIGGIKKYNGTYWFEATNSIGTKRSVYTDYKLQGYGITIDSGNSLSVSTQLQFENIGSLRLTCVVNVPSHADPSKDLPNITWYHNGLEVSNNTSERRGDDVIQIIQIEQPQLSDGGDYNCIAHTSAQTLWSFVVKVEIVKQPYVTVSPAIYEANVGSTVIFSCNIDNIDGVRGRAWDVQYRVKEPGQSFRDISNTHRGNSEGLLYIRNVKSSLDVRCEPVPTIHTVPRHSDAKVKLVNNPPVDVRIQLNERRYTVGETLIIRCTVKSILFGTSRMYWKHNEYKIGGPARGPTVMDDGRVLERYMISKSDADNSKTEVLIIEKLTKNSAGNYTCIFDAGDRGRYEDTYIITIHPSTPHTAISLVIAISFVLIVLIIMIVVLVWVVVRSRQHSYFMGATEKHNEARTMENHAS